MVYLVATILTGYQIVFKSRIQIRLAAGAEVRIALNGGLVDDDQLSTGG